MVLITGAGRGIGLHMAGYLLDRGFRVCGADLDIRGMRALIDRGPERFIGVECDVTDSRRGEEVMERVIESWARLDVLVNNAASAGCGPAGEGLEEMEVNYLGALRMTRAAIPHMAERGGIVHMVSSLLALTHALHVRLRHQQGGPGGPLQVPVHRARGERHRGDPDVPAPDPDRGGGLPPAPETAGRPGEGGPKTGP